MSNPPLGESCQRAGPSKRPVSRPAGSWRPQALDQNPRAAPSEELCLDGLAILLWPTAVGGGAFGGGFGFFGGLHVVHIEGPRPGPEAAGARSSSTRSPSI